MKQSGQKSKLCVTLIACIITIYGKNFCIFTLLSSALEGIVSRRASRPRASVARVSVIDIPT